MFPLGRAEKGDSNMSKLNSTRSGCKDVFHAFLVKNATYEGDLELPVIRECQELPQKLISFTKAVSGTDYDAWVHFYEDDTNFERLWNKPNKYLPILKRYKGVITPDFSLYRDMPLVMQQWNVYRSRAIGHWLQENGIPVIANVRWGDERTYDLCCMGVPHHATIAIGSHGCIKLLREREQFSRGLQYVVNKVKPKAIVVYGTTPDPIFQKYRDNGITIIQHDSDYMVSHREAVDT